MRRLMMLLAGSMCGALVGAVAALLLTPASGRELQLQVRTRFDTLRQDVREAYDARREQLEAELKELRGPRSPAK
jgi:gas vesicle protein